MARTECKDGSKFGTNKDQKKRNDQPLDEENQRSQTQRGSNTSARTAETKELTEHRSNHVRPESHDTSTNIPNLHEVVKEQPGVTPRDTKQPSGNDVSPPSTATSDLHKVKGPQPEPPCSSDTARGQGTTHSGATMDGTKEWVLGYNRLVDHVGIHGQWRLTEALNKDSLVRQKEYPTESSSKSRES
ncbi:hypothetical protein Taro_021163, partial [Colocasia esculenta]|nr:hypothetical protein [Colocasia esculenta]